MRYLVSEFGEARLSEISPTDVRAWYSGLVRSSLHPNTVAKIYRLFRAIMTTAVDDGRIPSNPVHVRGASKEEIVERPLLTWDQVEELAANIHPRFSAFVWLAAGSGLRFGELAGLTVDRIDLAKSVVHVDRAMTTEKGRGAFLGQPKTTTSYRAVSTPREITALVAEHVDQFCSGPEDLVFRSVRGAPLLNGYFAPFWRAARDQVGLPEVRFHDLRHFAGTEAASSGASLREVMARMGHSSSNASLRYLKASELRDQEIADAMSSRIRERVQRKQLNQRTSDASQLESQRVRPLIDTAAD